MLRSHLETYEASKWVLDGGTFGTAAVSRMYGQEIGDSRGAGKELHGETHGEASCEINDAVRTQNNLRLFKKKLQTDLSLAEV